MTLKNLLLKPYLKWFKPPTLDTPFSTIKLPSPFVSMGIIFSSFFIIVGGFVFCTVRNMPLFGAVRGNDGRPILSWIDLGGLNSQFLAEGIISSFTFTAAALSLISAYYLLDKNYKPNEYTGILRFLAMSSPLWCFFSYVIFHAKISSFVPSFTTR